MNLFVEDTEGGVTYGGKANLTSVLSEDTESEDEGYVVTGTVCDYVEGCLDITTTELLDDSYYRNGDCGDYVDVGQVECDGAGDDSMQVTFGDLEPQYTVKLWTGEGWGASRWFSHTYSEMFP